MTDSTPSIEQFAEKTEERIEKLGSYLVEAFQYLALFAIGATIIWAAIFAYIELVAKPAATVEDILLLFIFLELGAMVGIYFKTNRLPVQFLLYVAITVMTRSLASTLTLKDMSDQRLVTITGAIFALSVAVLVLRYAANKMGPFVSHAESDTPRSKTGD